MPTKLPLLDEPRQWRRQVHRELNDAVHPAILRVWPLR